ncbi:MAG: alkaline phosphatase D family protein [Chloroflexota bacterium]
MAELYLGPVVGGLSHQRAFLWGRSLPAPGEVQELHAWLGRTPDLSDARLAGRSLPLVPQQGYAGVAPLQDLTPATRYFYALTLSAEPPAPGGDYPSFKTFPEPGEAVDFNFAFGSCFRPEDESGGQIFHALEARRREEAGDLRFLLMIGDQVYCDDYKYNRLGKVAETLDEYRAVYAYVWSRPPLQQLLYNLPAFMTLDDHEVDDDWRWSDAQRSRATIPWWDGLARWLGGRPAAERVLTLGRVRNALQAYWEHQGMHAPPMPAPLQLDAAGQYNLAPQDAGSLAYTFEYGAAGFFVLDTRSMRVCGSGQRSMLGEGQWQMLKDWLLREEPRVKFIVSSCSLLFYLWIDIARDRWSGFPGERDQLLHFLAANHIQNVYVLTGDLHSAHAVHAELYGREQAALPLREFCSSPFEQQTNRLSPYFRLPIRNGLFKAQDCRWVVTRPNFGVVHVTYEGTGDPVVQFKLYGKEGELLGEA